MIGKRKEATKTVNKTGKCPSLSHPNGNSQYDNVMLCALLSDTSDGKKFHVKHKKHMKNSKNTSKTRKNYDFLDKINRKSLFSRDLTSNQVETIDK